MKYSFFVFVLIGAVDGTLEPIIAPYVCRKGYHAINVQGVVDADLRLLNSYTPSDFLIDIINHNLYD